MKKKQKNTEDEPVLQFINGKAEYIGNSKQFDELLAKYKELEARADRLQESLDKMDGECGWIMTKFGGQVRDLVKFQTEKEIDDIGMGILKKLINGGFINFKEDNGKKVA